MTIIQNSTITIDGCSINILQSKVPATTSLVFLHGKAFQAATWQELGTLDAVSTAGIPFVALDLPGFGKSPEAEIIPGKVINGILESLDIKKAILVGPSMGGKHAIEYTLENQDKVAGLVLVGSVGVTENRERLQDLPAKTLILWGENDQISDPANGVLLKSEIAGSELVVFAGANHPCYLEQPELWHKSLVDFVKTVTG